MTAAYLLWAWGCGDRPERGDAPAVPPVAAYLSAPDQTLPAGLVGTPYAAALQVSGGDPPYSWRVADAGVALPGGLALTDEGSVEGVPTQAGTFVLALEAADAVGRTKRTVVTLPIVLEPAIVRCGESLGGSFGGSAFGLDGPDLSDSADLAWLAVELPHDLTTRVELVFDNSATGTLYVERPAELLGSWDLDRHYVGHYLDRNFTDMTVAIDASTDPSLSTYETEALLPLLFVGQSAGDWSMEVVCTDGPIFESVLKYPVELGLPLAWDYEVYGDQTGVRIFTTDPLPDWMIWDETTGAITGTATEAGGWEFTLVAETPDGRRREEPAGLGVFAVVPVACGETVPFVTEEAYFDGEFYAWYDPRGYRVFRVPLDGVAASSVGIEVAGSDSHYLGLALPDPGELKFYGAADRLYLPGATAALTVDPRSYPSVGHYLDEGELYVSAGSIGAGLSMSLAVDCPNEPRADLAGLPVLEPFVPATMALPALGGVAPYTWEASGLPSGITLDPAGVLGGSTGALGVHDVELTVTDALGASSRETWSLSVGDSAACEGATLLACGESRDGTFTDTYYADGNGPASTEVFCVVARDRDLGFEIFSDQGELRVDVADPGRTAAEMFAVASYGTYVSWVGHDSSEGVSIDPFSWPDGDDYRDLAVQLAVRAMVPGDFTVHLVCD